MCKVCMHVSLTLGCFIWLRSIRAQVHRSNYVIIIWMPNHDDCLAYSNQILDNAGVILTCFRKEESISSYAV